MDVRVVGRELGVRYILEGSVRKAGDRLRITTQLVEAATGAHLWAEKFDGKLTDVFDLQDQITAGVVGAIEPSVRHAEIERARRKRPEKFDAYDLYLQALPHIWAHSPQERAKGLDFLNAALKIDPSYPAAHGLAAWAYQQRFQRGGANINDREAAIRHARTALSLDTDDTTALSLAGFAVISLQHDHQGGISATERALLHNPNSSQALGYSAWSTLWLAASTQRSIVLVNRFDLVHSIRFATYRKRLCALRSFVQVATRKRSKRSSAQFSTTLVSCQATRCERLALCVSINLKRRESKPIACLQWSRIFTASSPCFR